MSIRSNVAAIIIEPVQGEGGFHPAPTELLVALRAICDEHGILLIADEVQTGFARTGKMFGIENSGVEPDLMTIAKSLAGGFPLSGVIGRAAIMDAPDPGGLGGTYAGSPLACAAALAVLDVIAEEKLIDRANVLGDRIKGDLARIAQRNDTVPMSAIRGPGAMVAFDIVKSRGTEEPDADATKRVTAGGACRGAGAAVLRRPRQHDPHPDAADHLRRDPRRGHGQAGKGAGRGERLTPTWRFASPRTGGGRQTTTIGVLPETRLNRSMTSWLIMRTQPDDMALPMVHHSGEPCTRKPVSRPSLKM